MARLRLLHWKAAEASETIGTLHSAGHAVDYDEEFRPAFMKQWREYPPDAFVIDLSRLPSHGREIAIALRQSRKTAHIPLLFCGGAEEKVEQTRALLPDATYCTLPTLTASLKRALAEPPQKKPTKPSAMMDRYAGRSAAQKLGIREGSTVRLIDPPRDFMRALGDLPVGVQFQEERLDEAAGVTLCFIDSVEELQPTISCLRPSQLFLSSGYYGARKQPWGTLASRNRWCAKPVLISAWSIIRSAPSMKLGAPWRSR